MCEGVKFTKGKGGYYWVCENGLCYLTDDEFERLT